MGCPGFDPAPYIECDNGAPADFMEQWEAGAGQPARAALPDRVFDSAYGYEGERLAPPQLAAGTGDKVLSDKQVQQWRELGYVFVSGIWPDEVMDAAAAAAEELAPFPNPDGTAPPPLTRGGVFGNGSTQGIARPGAFPYHRPELSASKIASLVNMPQGQSSLLLDTDAVIHKSPCRWLLFSHAASSHALCYQPTVGRACGRPAADAVYGWREVRTSITNSTVQAAM